MKQAYLLGGEHHLRRVLVSTNEDGTMRPLWVRYHDTTGIHVAHTKPDDHDGYVWEKYSFLRALIRGCYVPTMATMRLTVAECDVIANRYRLSPWVADCGDENFLPPEYFADEVTN